MNKKSYEEITDSLRKSIKKVFGFNIQLSFPCLNVYAFSSTSVKIKDREIEFTITDTSPSSVGPFRGKYNWNIEIAIYNELYDPTVKEQQYSGQTVEDIRTYKFINLSKMVKDNNMGVELNGENEQDIEQALQILKEYLDNK